MQFSVSFCNAQCMRGFQFPDGSGIANIECRNGQWVHSKTGLAKMPDCGRKWTAYAGCVMQADFFLSLATCSPACENGGQCISFNICQCSKMHRGAFCQYSKYFFEHP